MSELTAASLFGGIEGFGLALERCGVRVAASVEIDTECRGVTRLHFPQAKSFNDVRTVTADDLRAAGFVPGRGILTGGFPCQDLSVAGRRTGLAGARSGLFWEIVRLADDLSPRWLVLENVPGLLSAVCSCPGDETCMDNGRAVRCGEYRTVPGGSDAHERRRWFPHVPHTPKGGACPGGCMELHGGAMGTVLGALGKLGYGFAYRVLDAQFFGVPQRRERVFIVGCLGDWAAPVEVLLEPEGGEGNPAPRETARPDTAVGIAGSAGVAGDPGLGTDGVTAYALGSHAGAADGDQTNRSHAKGGPVGSNISEETAYSLRAGRSQSVATLQGGGRRGHRIDAEGAAGGHLIPLAVRGREGGSQIEAGKPGDPMFTLRTPGGGSSHPMVSYALTARDAKGPDSTPPPAPR